VVYVASEPVARTTQEASRMQAKLGVWMERIAGRGDGRELQNR